MTWIIEYQTQLGTPWQKKCHVFGGTRGSVADAITRFREGFSYRWRFRRTG